MKKKTLRNIIAYIQGHINYSLYYSTFSFLIPTYIREQIEARINSMNPKCYTQGSCIKCGCKTTQLQMSFKNCEDRCYPSFLNKKLWSKLKINKTIYKNKALWTLKNNVFIKQDLKM